MSHTLLLHHHTTTPPLHPTVLFTGIGMFQTLLSKGHEDSKDVQHSISRVTLDVEHLSYSPPPPSLINSFRESVLSSGMAPQMVNDRVTIKLHSEVDSEIIDVSFRALPGKFTAVISQEPAERKTLMELISGRRIYGEFDGKVTLLQSKNSPGALNADTATAYVPRVSCCTNTTLGIFN